MRYMGGWSWPDLQACPEWLLEVIVEVMVEEAERAQTT